MGSDGRRVRRVAADALIAGSDVTTMMYVVDVKFSMNATKVLLPARRPRNLACAFLQARHSGCVR